MKEGERTGVSLPVIAAVAGVGYISGREIALFFGQLGWAGWLSIALASTAFGLLTALLCRCAIRTNADSFAVLCRRMLGSRTAAVALWLHGLLLAFTAIAMLLGAGRIGALALPMRLSFLWGAGTALLLALLVNLARLRSLRWMGLALAVLCTIFYVLLALDSRPVQIHIHGAVELALEGNAFAALAMALLYAAMNACVAAGVAVRFGGGEKPWRTGLRCAMTLLAILLCMNAALARGGRELLFQATPTVLLAARWGLAGFWVRAALGFLGAVATLSAALGGLLDIAVKP